MNQCEGCQCGLPTEQNPRGGVTHLDPSARNPFDRRLTCTRDRYEDAATLIRDNANRPEIPDRSPACDECARSVPLLDGQHHEPYADDGYDRITQCRAAANYSAVPNSSPTYTSADEDAARDLGSPEKLRALVDGARCLCGGPCASPAYHDRRMREAVAAELRAPRPPTDGGAGTGGPAHPDRFTPRDPAWRSWAR